MSSNLKTHHVHLLKIFPEYYDAQLLDLKNFEIRKDDRDFRVGDEIWLREFDPKTNEFTGRDLSRVITYITDYQQKPGYVVLGTKVN